MSFTHDIWRPIKRNMLTLFGTLALMYLVFHILQGERGLLAIPEHKRSLEDAKQHLEKLDQESLVWRRRVALLNRDTGIDLDMLEERSRLMLNFTRPDEAVILLKPN